jgi:hypothetical protein
MIYQKKRRVNLDNTHMLLLLFPIPTMPNLSLIT